MYSNYCLLHTAVALTLCGDPYHIFP